MRVDQTGRLVEHAVTGLRDEQNPIGCWGEALLGALIIAMAARMRKIIALHSRRAVHIGAPNREKPM